ncbi:hypothetical protein CLOSTMETH_01485 [[Clostridium] methylpentosum DSM 5476]|uniref:Uncharacterized protein n=1 Tax=[Clostridium] methylpentosum DSM 5476 TaxID=537013 RepID=C0ECB6_9FIRM|nr:hypothetical protein CLOSTMETH_01485 [[Clostridium] methylpentosum DSM 5476]
MLADWLLVDALDEEEDDALEELALLEDAASLPLHPAIILNARAHTVHRLMNFKARFIFFLRNF